jgi:hypothetical protein
MRMQVGDVILTGVKAQGWVSKLIKFGAWVGRYPVDARRFSHAAIVWDVKADGTVMLCEAIRQGVKIQPFHYADGDYVHIPMGLASLDQMRVQKFCSSVVAANARYGFATFVACGINCILAHLKHAPVSFTVGATKICSGLVADALAHTGYIWGKPVDVIMPADIWIELGARAAS